MRIRLHKMQRRLTTTRMSYERTSQVDALTILLVFRWLDAHCVLCRTHYFVSAIELLLDVIAYAVAQEPQNRAMDGGVDQELLIEEHDHILDGTQDLGLDAKRAISLAQSYECAEDV